MRISPCQSFRIADDMQIQFSRPQKRQKLIARRSLFDDNDSDDRRKRGEERHRKDENPVGQVTDEIDEEGHGDKVNGTQGVQRYRPIFVPDQKLDEAKDNQNDSPPESSANRNKDDSSEEEDYMKMIIPDLPQKHVSDTTYYERRKRALREQEAKSIARPPLVVQREKLERGLDTSLFAADEKAKDVEESSGDDNIALAIMKKMGFIPGQGLGKTGDDVRHEPLRPVLKYGRGGIGMASAHREQIQSEAKRAQEMAQAEKQSFIDRKREEQLEKKILGQLREAQNICQELDISIDPRLESILYSHNSASAGPNSREYKELDVPMLRSVNFLWREVVVERQNADYEKRLRSRILDRPSSVDADEPVNLESRVEEFVPEDYMDEELETFNSLESAKKLEVVLQYLRQKYYYCFWCGCKYEDPVDLDQNCPGLTEEDHE
ncbi:uncharacterized protein V1513DRAFT_208925 [Lipomyces chichibuensis]|uniref:uncharacterized protein n=1 Tax=Lipomyces chichibuensis TaxID=1546026 RepID=UPI003344080A